MTRQTRPFRNSARWLLASISIVFGLLTVAPAPVIAAEPGGPTTFSAEEPASKVDPNDPKAMLMRCDTMLEQCRTDEKSQPFLIAAYLVLWAILVVYFFLARRGQLKLRGELTELRARLREYEEARLDQEDRL